MQLSYTDRLLQNRFDKIYNYTPVRILDLLNKSASWLNFGARRLNGLVPPGAALYFSRMKLILMVFALFSIVTAHSSAQQTPGRLDSSLVRFFCGEWKGVGAFANGRPISATLSFRLSLDSAWLVSEHRDMPPNWLQGKFVLGRGRVHRAVRGHHLRQLPWASVVFEQRLGGWS